MKKNLKKWFLYVKATAIIATASPVFAKGGLDKGTDELNNLRVWFYGFLGVFCLGYISWQVFLALNDKKQWNDVGFDIGKVAAAGGSLALADFAWSIWGS